MKVIVAGMFKTGTKSMVAALKELDYDVYDYLDHFWYHGNEWINILTHGGSQDDFKRMYEDVDAIADSPVYLFWEEISQVFPDCKIILTVRDEESWYQSLLAQISEINNNKTFLWLQTLSPTGRRFFRFSQLLYSNCCGYIVRHPFDLRVRSKMGDQRFYRQHQTYCLQNAPKDRLLVYNVKEGWGPLCKFLGKEIPNKEFPHENKGATIIGKLMKTHPATLRMQREMLFILSALASLGAFGTFKLYKSGHWRLCLHGIFMLKNIFKELFSFGV